MTRSLHVGYGPLCPLLSNLVLDELDRPLLDQRSTSFWTSASRLDDSRNVLTQRFLLTSCR